MKEYIILTIKENNLIFDFKNISGDAKKTANTNNFCDDSLYYSFKYFRSNYEKILKFLKDKDFKLDTLTIMRLVTFKYPVLFMDGLGLKYLRLDFPSTIGLEDYCLFMEVNSLKRIDCYYMPKFIREKFEDKGVIVKSYNNHAKVSNRFMLGQDAFDYETLYYKKNLEIREIYPDILADLKEFLKINYTLKSIHLYVFSKDIIEAVIDLVKHDEARNIIVFLHQSHDDKNFITYNFAWLKELNKKCKNDYTCEFRIVYSNSFLSNNLFKQLSFNNLKLISIFCIYVSLVSFIIVRSYQYVEEMSILELNNQIINGSYGASGNITTRNDEVQVPNEVISDNLEELGDEDISAPDEPTKEEIKDKYAFDKVFSNLKKINKETVGYLVVNNTEISYPVVQHDDNSYYLKRDFYKKKSSMGWVYLDYRNDGNEFDDNNIIYAHSMKNGTMFGTLKNVLSSSWRKSKENMIISYDTPNGSYKFKIFAGYRVDYTTDYLKVNFDTEEDFNSFVKLIKGRSSFKTSDNVKYGDSILTLSTCAGSGNKRLVVHAVLITEEES